MTERRFERPVIQHETHPAIAELIRNRELLEMRIVRKGLTFVIRGVEVESLPDALSGSAILVSNYPGVRATIAPVLKVGCMLPGKEFRLLAIARESLLTKGNSLIAGLVHNAILPAATDESGKYRLGRGPVFAKQHLENKGVLWLSTTGKNSAPFDGNGIQFDDIQHGAAMFAGKTETPIIPMALIADKRGKITQITFGYPLTVPPVDPDYEFDQNIYYKNFSRWVTLGVAGLLPHEQRGGDGGFENLEMRAQQIQQAIASFY